MSVLEIKPMRRPARSQIIINLIREHSFKNIAEVGVCKGETAIPVMCSCQLNNYYLIDPKFNDDHGLMATAAEHIAVSLINTTSEEAVKLFQDGSLDLVFIDALHDEKNVDRDCRLWKPKIRKGGIACGHDYDNKRFPGVKIAVDRIFGIENVRTEPVKACKVWIVEL